MPVPNLKAAAAAAMSFALIAVPPAANAEDVRPTPVAASASPQSSSTTLYSTSLSAGGDAARYSDALNTIGVVVYYGAGQDPVRVGDAFVAELERRGVKARAFAAPVPGDGTSVLYQIGADGLGPLGVNTAAANMSRAIELSKGRDQAISPGFVPIASTR